MFIAEITPGLRDFLAYHYLGLVVVVLAVIVFCGLSLFTRMD